MLGWRHTLVQWLGLIETRIASFVVLSASSNMTGTIQRTQECHSIIGHTDGNSVIAITYLLHEMFSDEDLFFILDIIRDHNNRIRVKN